MAPSQAATPQRDRAVAASRADLNIANVNCSVSCRPPTCLQSLDACYESFLGIALGSRETLEITVRVELGDPPLPGSLVTVFDTGDSWVMSTDGDFYYLTLNPGRLPGQQLWTAQIARDVTRVTVYCGERMVSRTGNGIAVTNPLTYPLDQILLTHVLARHEGALVHAAGASIGGKALLFAGRSGAGKSTLSRLLDGRPGLALLSDDRIAVRKVGGAFTAYGTPWPGDQGAALNVKARLRGICFLQHAGTNRIEPLTPSQALQRFLPVVSVPWYDRDAVSSALPFVDDLLAHVPAFDLHFRPGDGVAELAQQLVQTGPGLH